ncbi:MAG: thioredoxin-disulfide reductase [Lachnospiraceae bacterium]|nr:thioredoxin-disulfide reductase [Lachnospiraceae bacterium]
MGKIYDVIIIGAGPAGMTAAIYAKRAELETLLIEKNFMGGGQILNTYEIDNFPGFKGYNGFDLGQKFSEHVDELGVERISEEVRSVELAGEIKTIWTEEAEYQTKTVVLATGASPKKLGAPGEEKLSGTGVSYCATCDGAFFKNKITVVIGGGDVAVEDAIFLARGCEKVYLVHRRNELRATKSLQTALFQTPNIECVWDSVAVEILGDTQVSGIRLKNVKTEAESELKVDGVFVAVGNEPNNAWFTGEALKGDGVELDKGGFVIAGEDGVTSLPGVFVAGDLRSKRLRQVATAVGDGANVITSVTDYLTESAS